MYDLKVLKPWELENIKIKWKESELYEGISTIELGVRFVYFRQKEIKSVDGIFVIPSCRNIVTI